MMEVVPFISDHLNGFDIQDGQGEMRSHLAQDGYAQMIEDLGTSYTLTRDGKVIACGGVGEISGHRGLAWVLISKELETKEFLFFAAHCRQKIRESSYARIEAVVRSDFDNGHRMARLMGFKCETPDGMVNWFAPGIHGHLYVWGGK